MFTGVETPTSEGMVGTMSGKMGKSGKQGKGRFIMVVLNTHFLNVFRFHIPKAGHIHKARA